MWGPKRLHNSPGKVNGGEFRKWGNSVIFVVKLLFLNDSKEAFSATKLQLILGHSTLKALLVSLVPHLYMQTTGPK